VETEGAIETGEAAAAGGGGRAGEGEVEEDKGKVVEE